MRYNDIGKKKLYEMPYLTTAAVSWGLEDLTKNKRRTEMMLHNPHQVVKEYAGEGTLIRANTTGGGTIAFIAEDPKIITYFMQFDEKTSTLGRAATQVKLWRGDLAPMDLTSFVFFDVMLPEFSTMISDRIQTRDGKRFWVTVMGKAVTLKYEVGYLDENDEPTMYDKSKKITQWLIDIDPWGWGQESVHHERRFFITRK